MGLLLKSYPFITTKSISTPFKIYYEGMVGNGIAGIGMLLDRCNNISSILTMMEAAWSTWLH